jgi:hypothetical protein
MGMRIFRLKTGVFILYPSAARYENHKMVSLKVEGIVTPGADAVLVPKDGYFVPGEALAVVFVFFMVIPVMIAQNMVTGPLKGIPYIEKILFVPVGR